MNKIFPQELEWSNFKSSFKAAVGKMADLEDEHHKAIAEFSDIIKQLRQHHGLSQEQLAKMMGVSAMYISLLERGKRPWNRKIMNKMSQKLEIL